MMMTPTRASAVCGARMSPRVMSVAGFGTMMPALWSPMTAINRPMPPATAA